MLVIEILFFTVVAAVVFFMWILLPCKILKIQFEELLVGLRPEWERADGEIHILNPHKILENPQEIKRYPQAQPLACYM